MFLHYFHSRPTKPLDAKAQYISLLPDGIETLESSGLLVTVLWSQVTRIATWKADLFTYDEILLGFEIGNPKNCVIVSEQQPGFSQLTEELPKRFPTISIEEMSRKSVLLRFSTILRPVSSMMEMSETAQADGAP